MCRCSSSFIHFISKFLFSEIPTRSSSLLKCTDSWGLRRRGKEDGWERRKAEEKKEDDVDASLVKLLLTWSHTCLKISISARNPCRGGN
jgi:hypothetical protein